MKKIIFFMLLTISVSSYSQNCEIYNYSTVNLNFLLSTKPLSGAAFPVLDTGLTLYVLTPAMLPAIYSNPPGIPYASSGLPTLNTWRRKTISGGAWINTSTAFAQTLFTNTQQWDFIKWNFPAISGFAGTAHAAIGQSVNVVNPATGLTVYFDVFYNGGAFTTTVVEF